MKKSRWLLRLALLLLTSCFALAVSVIATGTAGTESDPLVTLSYLNETFMTQLLEKVEEKLAVRDKELSDKLNAQIAQDTKALEEKYGAGVIGGGQTGGFSVVSLSEGQTLYGDVGCEVMLRVGAGECVSPSNPGLIDETDGTALGNGGKLARNHLYMMTVDGRGVKAAAATVKLLARGGYSIE